MKRSEIVAEAREWVGTRYKHQHSLKNVACDCLGLIRGVYKHFFDEEPEITPNYSPTWGEVSNKEVLLDAAARHLIALPGLDFFPGSVLVFRMRRGRAAKHCAIVGDYNTMIHGYQGVGRVCEGYIVPYWRDRIAGIFDFPGVT